jgi:hypothetical protein
MQQGFHRYVEGSTFTMLSDRDYEIAATVPHVIASGTYKLLMFSLTVDGATRAYQFGKDFKSDILLRLNNPRHVRFPAVKEIRVNRTGS